MVLASVWRHPVCHLFAGLRVPTPTREFPGPRRLPLMWYPRFLPLKPPARQGGKCLGVLATATCVFNPPQKGHSLYRFQRVQNPVNLGRVDEGYRAVHE